ncbi:hypothetical protein [Runella aurantiaca]|uniref:Lipocalin-like domain-containing protein n=1 Tax=Runella aurantiaca TaxID=2282308 RepID=A0A369IHE5_9BACT|nr:hypothetical protein [Runella aurantiaca]RDB07767.1 hypothetical protein DVG78_01550 [Runella aurantiaca]
MKKYLYAALFITSAMLAGCSKSEPEPEPAEQVIGSYTVDKVTVAYKYVDSPVEESQSYIFPFKNNQGELTAIVDVSKSASNIITLTYVETAKYTNGQTETSKDVYSSIELKPSETASGVFDMYSAGVKSGTVGGGNLNFEDITSLKDTVGRALTFAFRISGKKSK